jgi:hypothetical protein
MQILTWRTVACIIGLALLAAPEASQAQQQMQSAAPAATSAPNENAILLTIFLRHDQSKTLGEINDHLKQTGYYAKFPPAGIEVVSWESRLSPGT